ncbi:MAG TPA: SapC family protein [Candidatus Acidoferrum sp.]|nr:SapC family protein [Candidatus Acidoferrum sp.]
MKNRPNIESVDKNRHAGIKVRFDPDYAHMKTQNLSAITMSEITAAGSSFPVVFVKLPQEDEFRLVAMFGLTQGENVYYHEGGWDATYVPLTIQTYPLVIGHDDRTDAPDQLTVCIDRNSARVNQTEGDALFDAKGDATEFMKSRLMALHDVFEEEKRAWVFISKLREFDLLTPLEVVVKPVGRDVRRITGMWTLNRIKLLNLPAAQLQELHKQNFLSACYLILSASFQFHRLMQLRRRKVAENVENYWIDLEPQQRPAANG